ncbi:hypothetical protein [Knoellia sp. Soil729]|uniref:hypothetical protein n=1 Tax=Knoellia sp. Soil729 TaxID=1736394 RepID=UPI0006F7250F|nr:hypothetical protein [Knoellia sp. Soil729]KRE42787.1 hypothetical protein ASG74_10450 [Knoellia sp. Soil729]
MHSVRAISFVVVAALAGLGGASLAVPAAAAGGASSATSTTTPTTFGLGDGVALIGDSVKVSNLGALNKYLQAGPTAGTPTARVDAAAKTVTLTVDDPTTGNTATLTMAWPARVGSWGLNPTGAEAEGKVSLTRRANDSACTFSQGILTVYRAEASPTGEVAALSADVGGSCAKVGSTTTVGALVRIGDSEPSRQLAIPRATPLTYSAGALAGTVITHEVTVTNAGARPWKVTDMAIASRSTSVPSFRIVPEGNRCSGLTLASGETCTVQVTTTATTSSINEYLLAGGDQFGGFVVPLSLEGYAPVEPPTAVTAAAGRLSATVSWQPPSVLPRDGYRVYDVTGGARTLLTSAPPSATSMVAPGAGPRQLALVAANGRFAESPDAVVDVPAVASELVANDWYGFSAGFDTGRADVTPRALGVERVDLDPSRTRWVTTGRSDVSVCSVATEQCIGVPGTMTTSAADAPLEAVWLPDGTVAFLRGDPSSESSRAVWVVRTDGSGLRRIAAIAEGHDLAATPSATEVVVHSSEGFGRLVRVNVTSGAITTVPGTDWVDDFTVTTRGQLVVQSRDDKSLTNGARTTTLMNLDGSAARRLALPVGDNREVTFDQTGTQLAFARYTGDWQATLWVAAADGSQARQVSTTSRGWIDLEWSVGDRLAPSASVTVPAYTARSATVAIGATDGDDAAGSLVRKCRLDAATTWTTCGPTLALSALAAGTHTLRAQVTDAGGLQSAVVTKSWVVDAAAPTTALSAPASVQTTPTMTLTWAGIDTGGSGLASYDVRARTAPTSAGLGAYQYPTSWQKRTTRTLPLTLSKGYQYCFSVRSRDRAGNVGAWSAERCTTMPLDDRSLTASMGWTRGTSSSYLFSTYSKTMRTGAQLTRTSVSARRISLVATTCSTCGSVDVYHAGVKLGRVSLYSSTTKVRQVKSLPLQSVTRKGTVAVRSTSTRPVYIDALAVTH